MHGGRYGQSREVCRDGATRLPKIGRGVATLIDCPRLRRTNSTGSHLLPSAPPPCSLPPLSSSLARPSALQLPLVSRPSATSSYSWARAARYVPLARVLSAPAPGAPEGGGVLGAAGDIRGGARALSQPPAPWISPELPSHAPHAMPHASMASIARQWLRATRSGRQAAGCLLALLPARQTEAAAPQDWAGKVDACSTVFRGFATRAVASSVAADRPTLPDTCTGKRIVRRRSEDCGAGIHRK